MNYTKLYMTIPAELANLIAEFDPTPREKMNIVITELKQYNKNMEMYEAQERFLSSLTDWEIALNDRLGTTFHEIDDPCILSPHHPNR